MGTSKSHIGQSVGRGGKFRNQIFASCNLKIPHKDKNKRGIYLENPVYYVHCEKTELFPSSSSF